MTIESNQIERKESCDEIIDLLREDIHENPDCKHRTILRAIKSADPIGLKAAPRYFCKQTFKE